MELSKLLIELSNAFGPTGFEREVREIFQKEVADAAEVSYDNLGGIIATHEGDATGPRILLAAHLDEVGLMVRGVLPSGYLKVVPLGGWYTPALLAQRVLVRTKSGDHIGVIGAKPPHYMSEEEKNRQLKINDLYIDVGAGSRDEVTALGVEPGNPVVPAAQAKLINQASAIVGKAFDDRAGCAAILKVISELDHNHPNTVYGAGTVQEENGAKGAGTIASIIKPDVCLVLEGAPADDFPDAGSIIQGRMGGGPQIRYFDPSMIANQALADMVIAEAKKQAIAYQVAVREGGGTDGAKLQLDGSGVPTIVIGVPVRYAHSHHGIISIKDVEATVQLVKGIIDRLDHQRVEKLKQYPW
jgi:putative aminopeptidase FrvX